ncbi:MAG: hypothetical protein ACR2GQ_05325 [Gemmatimonadota bacterium]
MHMRRSTRSAAFAVPGFLLLFTACGDDGTMGPMFGDLAFAPSFVNIGLARDTSFTLTNSGDVALGPILIGLDLVRLTTNADSLCAGVEADVVPSSISSLAVGASTTVDVTLDLSNTTVEFCRFAQYDADIAAAVNNQILGVGTIRFDHEEPEPMFGDLVFAPSLVDVGAGRDTAFTLRNVSDIDLGPIALALDMVRRTSDADSLCTGAQAVITPSTVTALVAGDSTTVAVSLDLSGTTESSCPFEQYDADIAAAVSDSTLGIGTIRFDYPDPTP